jgi:hypothetical protein
MPALTWRRAGARHANSDVLSVATTGFGSRDFAAGQGTQPELPHLSATDKHTIEQVLVGAAVPLKQAITSSQWQPIRMRPCVHS